MASSSGALEVMGHNKQRLKISPFSGPESFPVYQVQLLQQCLFTYYSSMNDKCETDFQALLKEIATQAADLSNEPKRANLQVLL